jgi:hypothetical protein
MYKVTNYVGLKRISNSAFDVLANFNIFLKDTRFDSDKLFENNADNRSSIGRLLRPYKGLYTKSQTQISRNGKREYPYYCLFTSNTDVNDETNWITTNGDDDDDDDD